MNALDQLELDALAATGDIECAEMAGLLARAAMDDMVTLGCYMLGIPHAVELRIWRERG